MTLPLKMQSLMLAASAVQQRMRVDFRPVMESEQGFRQMVAEFHWKSGIHQLIPTVLSHFFSYSTMCQHYLDSKKPELQW